MLLTKRILLGAASTLALSSSLMAAELAPDVVVTATRTEIATSQVGSSISILTADDIAERQYSFTVDALRALPGITVSQNGAFGGQASVRIRGAASEQTLVLVDGVVVNDPSSPGAGFNFANLDPYDIERIEVLRGPQSTLYGSQAIGGVVNIITKRATKPFSVSAFLEAGSFNTIRSGGSVSGKEGETDYHAALSGIQTNGISKADEHNGNSEEDGYDSFTVSGNIGSNLTQELRAEASLRYSENRNEFDSFGPTDGNEVGYTRELQAAGTLYLSTFDGRLENSVTATHAFVDRDNDTNGVRSFSTTGITNSLEYLGEIAMSDDWNAIVGAKTEDTKIRGGSSITINSVYGQLQVLPIEDLSLIGGVRYDDHETAGGVTTFRFTGAYALQETDTVFRASWGEGFKAPTPFQLTFFCCGATGPNTNLKPEESRGWDAGIEQTFAAGKANLQVNYYQQDVTNQIKFSAGSYSNISRVETSGWEIIGTARPVAWLDVSANFTHQAATDAATGTQLTRVPTNLATLNITTRPMDRLSVGGSVTYNGDETDAGGPVANWVRVDLRSAYQLNDEVELYGRVENLFDEQYQDILGYGTPSVSGYIGVRFRG